MHTQIFVGIKQTTEILMYLSKNAKWQNDYLEKSTSLQIAHYQNKPYLGFLLPSSIFCKELNKTEVQIKTELQVYCPKINLDAHPLVLFPITLIS